MSADSKWWFWLVVEPYPSEKYQSVGMIIPNIWKRKCSKPPSGDFLWFCKLQPLPEGIWNYSRTPPFWCLPLLLRKNSSGALHVIIPTTHRHQSTTQLPSTGLAAVNSSVLELQQQVTAMQQHWQIKVMHQEVAWNGMLGVTSRDPDQCSQSVLVRLFVGHILYPCQKKVSSSFYIFKSWPWIFTGLVCSSFRG